MLIVRRKKYLNDDQLKMLGDHKYKSECCSLLDPYFQPYWNKVVHYVPLWVAPNLITLVGLLINVITTLMIMWYSPDCKSDVPSFAYYSCAIGLFAYQTLDAIDGKQARRTGSQSPLGELFDHGCDAISSVFVGLSLCVTLQLGDHPSFMFIFFFVAIIAFYISHWQTYITGTLRFGKLDVTEAQVTIIISHLATAMLGNQIWRNKIFDVIELRWLICIAGIAGCVIMMYRSFTFILFDGAATGENEKRTRTSVAGTSVLSPGIPLAIVVLFAFLMSKLIVPNMYREHPLMFIFMIGNVCAKITNELVVAHMTKHEIAFKDNVILGGAFFCTCILLTLNRYCDYLVSEYVLLWCAVILTTVDLLHYCGRVCNEICQYLHIMLFTITPIKPTSNGVNKRLAAKIIDDKKEE